jgi:hypothetical protein
MNKNITKFLLVTAGALLFNLLFWHEKLGLNTVLYDLFVLIALFSLYPKSLLNGTVRWLLLAHLICLAMVVVHNTPVSKAAFFITLCLLAGFAEYAHRSAWFAGGSMLMNILFMVAGFGEMVMSLPTRNRKTRRFSRVIRFAIFPLLILLVFFWLYSAANDAFRQLTEKLSAQLEWFFENFFDFFTTPRLLFFLLGVFITGAILLKSRIGWFSQKDAACSDALSRKKISWKERRQRSFYQFVSGIMGRFARGMMALKNENTTGIISLALLNLLLLVVNAVDIDYLWLHFSYSADQPVYKMVHEGTELLIASIVLAMIILLFFFKGNLNFYRRNRWLKAGAYAWIAQNGVLVASVALRDYYYIAKHGLAYKRIGVLFFLLMVLIGLLTVFIKIARKKTNYYLLRVNAWAGIVILVLATTIHWDELIAGYNLSRRNQVALDVPFLLSLSDKTIPLIEQNKEVVKKYEAAWNSKKTHFLNKRQALTWLSWNYADAYTEQYLRNYNNNPQPKIQQP